MLKYFMQNIKINKKYICPKGQKGNFYEIKSKNPYNSPRACDAVLHSSSLRNPLQRGDF